MKRVCAIVGASAVAMSASAALGQFTFFNNRAAFNAAAGAVSVESFNALEAPFLLPGENVPFQAGLVQLISPTEGSQFIEEGLAPNNIDGTNYLDLFVAPADFGLPEEKLTIRLSAPATAFGFDFFDLFSSSFGSGIDVIVNGEVVFNTQALGITNNSPAGAVGPLFLGFTSLSQFTEITLASPAEGPDGFPPFGEIFGVDNLTFNAIPTPGAAALLGLGGLAAARRRRQAQG